MRAMSQMIESRDSKFWHCNDALTLALTHYVQWDRGMQLWPYNYKYTGYRVNGILSFNSRLIYGELNTNVQMSNCRWATGKFKYFS